MLRFGFRLPTTTQSIAVVFLTTFIGCSSGEVDQVLASKVAQFAEDARNSLASRDYDLTIQLTDQCLASGLLQQQLLADVVSLRVKAFLGKGDLEKAKDEISNFESIAIDTVSVHALKYAYLTKKGDNYNAERELEQARSIDPTFSIVP